MMPLGGKSLACIMGTLVVLSLGCSVSEKVNKHQRGREPGKYSQMKVRNI